MLRLPRVCLNVVTVFKTSVINCVPEHEAPFIMRTWYDRKTNTRYATKIPHPATSPANDYWFDFPSIEMEWKRINEIYRDKVEAVYPDFEDFERKLNAALEAYAENPVLPPTLAPKIPPPAILELLEAFKDDIETPDILDLHGNVSKPGVKLAGIALALGASGITSASNVAAATLGELSRNNALTSTVAMQVRAAARALLAAKADPKNSLEKQVERMRKSGKAPDVSETPVGAIAL